MKEIKNEIYNELTKRILPFWLKLRDDENGGFFCQMNYDLEIDKEADKGVIALSRVLWSFSAAYNELRDERYLEAAHHAYEFLKTKAIDHKHKGLFWMLDYKGNPVDTRKHVYVQAFGIYALSEYYKATNSEEALNNALELYNIIKEKGFDYDIQAYKEEFTIDWVEAPNEKLSENGVVADITMNTHLHVLEAYTTLYSVWQDEQLEKELIDLIYAFKDKFYDNKTKFLKVFLNKSWETIIDLKSFGHDIEASWLIDEAVKVTKLHDEAVNKMIIDIGYNIADYAIQKDGSLINEEDKGDKDYTRVWWVQAEAVVGFLNIYEKNQDERLKIIIKGLWNYIKDNIIDKRINGEWFHSIENNGKPSTEDIVEPWKAPYHNSRFCLEVIKRIS